MPADSPTRTARSYRAVRLVLVTLVLGAVLAVVPRPAFAVERGVRVDTETPDLVPVTAAGEEAEAAPHTDGTEVPAPLEAAPPEPARLQAEAADVADFEMIGASFSSGDLDGARIRVRIDGTWEPWQELTGLGQDHGPEPGGDEAAGRRPGSDPIWVGDGDGYELDLPADAADVTVHLVRETEERVSIVDDTAEAGAAPTIHGRGSWGARPPTVQAGAAPYLNRAVIHHTVNSNSYGAASVPSMIRGIQAYHMDALGWWDIGYNFIVDRFGQVWEGRSGSTYQAIIGAHAQGSNTGSTGIAFLGDGRSSTLNIYAHEAVAALIAWKLPYHGTFFTGPEIVGHRDVFATTCPGNWIHGQLGSIRARAVQLRPAPGPFLDVHAGVWNATEVAWGKAAGIISGYPDGTFRPHIGVSRSQLVNMLWNLAGRPAATVPHGFSDVARPSWHMAALDWARETGVITGYADGSFRGDLGVPRNQIIVLLWRWQGQPDVATPHNFTDVAVGSWADAALRWGRAAGVVGGYPDGSYRPGLGVNRGQLLPMLYDIRP